MSRSWDACPLCGEPNSHELAYCRHCGFRLPWADSAENFANAEGELIKRDSPILPHILPDSHPVPMEYAPQQGTHLPRCRFCDGVIEVTMKNCPHCKEWLTSATREAVDVWQLGHDERNFEKATVKPRGCFVGLLNFLFLIKLR